MSRKDQTPRKEPKPDRLHFHFQWSGVGLAILESPAPLELYTLPDILQQSLWAARNGSCADDGDYQTGPSIPIGSLAQMLHRAPWGNLSLNFELGPDRRLFLYISLAFVQASCRGTPLYVELIADDQRISSIAFKQGKYSSPALGPGRYTFSINGGSDSLTEVVVHLDRSEDSSLA